MNQDDLRVKLNAIVSKGLVAKAIADKVEISPDNFSRFRNGHICLCQKDAERLEAFLDKVVIPD